MKYYLVFQILKIRKMIMLTVMHSKVVWLHVQYFMLFTVSHDRLSCS